MRTKLRAMIAGFAVIMLPGAALVALDGSPARATTSSASLPPDVTPPDTTITGGPADGSVTGGDVTFTFIGTEGDTDHFECKYTYYPWERCTSPKSYHGLLSGPPITVQIRAVDAAGNADPTPAQRTWTVDTTRPVARITDGPADGSFTSSTAATFTLATIPADNADHYACALDGEPEWACTSPWVLTGLTEGRHTVQVWAINGFGYRSRDAVERSWTVDTTPPSDTSIDPLDGRHFTVRRVRVTFAGPAQPDDVVQCRVDGSAWTACTSPMRLTRLKRGHHTVKVRAVDRAGNTSKVAAATFTVANLKHAKQRLATAKKHLKQARTKLRRAKANGNRVAVRRGKHAVTVNRSVVERAKRNLRICRTGKGI